MLPAFDIADKLRPRDARRIGKMYGKFGIKGGTRCRACQRFERRGYHDRAYAKCHLFGVTRGAGTDWNGNWIGCGAWEPRGEE